MVLLSADWRSALIVVTTHPLCTAHCRRGPWGAGQTINIMTLGGLALAVGILVDESTVVMETFTATWSGARRAVAVLEASKEVQIPRLLALLCVLAVFVPSFFIWSAFPAPSLYRCLWRWGFAMAASYYWSCWFRSPTWILRPHAPADEKGAPSLLAGCAKPRRFWRS